MVQKRTEPFTSKQILPIFGQFLGSVAPIQHVEQKFAQPFLIVGNIIGQRISKQAGKK